MEVVTRHYESSNVCAMDEKMDASTVVERTVSIPGLDVHLREAGAGTPILLLHGFPQSSREFVPVMPALAAHAHVVAPDLRGAGETGAPASTYEIGTVVTDLVALLDELGLDRVAVVGHDWGAIAAYELCFRHPDRVSACVAIAAPPPHLQVTPQLIIAMVKAMRILWFQFVVGMPWLGPRMLSRGDQRLPRWILRLTEVRPKSPADVDAYLAALREPARARAASVLYRRIITPCYVKIVTGGYRGQTLSARTLVLFGDDDRNVPHDALLVESEDAPDLRVEFVPHAAHYLVDDAPEEVIDRVTAFLGLTEPR